MKNFLSSLSRAHNLFGVMALAVGLVFIIMIPPFWGLDEPSHFNKVYQYGEAIWSLGSSRGEIPKNIISLENYAVGDLVDDKMSGVLARKDVDNSHIYKIYETQSFSHKAIFPRMVAVYPPIAYIGQIVGVVIAHIFNASIGPTLFMGRLGSLLMYGGIIWFSLKLLQNTKMKWLIFVIALLPTTLFQAAVITADSMVIALALLFIALFIRLLNPDSYKSVREMRVYFYTLALAGILLSIIKPNYIFLNFGVMLVPYEALRSKRLGNLVKLAFLMIAGFASLLWVVISSMNTHSTIKSLRPDGVQVIVSHQVSTIIHSPQHVALIIARSIIANGDSYLTQMIGFLGWNYVTIPLIVLFILCLTLVVAGVWAKEEVVRLRKPLVWLGLSMLVGIFSILLVFFVTFTPSGKTIIEGVQGRYFLPFLAPLVMLGASFIPLEIKIKDKIVPLLFGSIMSGGLLVSIVYYWLATY